MPNRSLKVMFSITAAVSLFMLILLFFASVHKASAAEPITDAELAEFYGRCFSNPYCKDTTKCPAIVGDETEGGNCCYCVTKQGEVCKDNLSIWPDPDGCDDSTEPCPGTGDCGMYVLGECCLEVPPDSELPMPDCNENNYDVCDN